MAAIDEGDIGRAAAIDGIPPIGFGTFPLTGGEARAAIGEALELGFRHIDTAQWYENEDAVGDAIAIAAVPRDELFVVTKVHPDNLTADRCLDSVRRSLDWLRLDCVDLLLAHWPPRDQTTEATVDLLLEAREQGLATRIGVSNFNVPMLERAVAHAPGAIATNQIEFHPLLDQSRLLDAARRLGTTLTAYCPLARGEAIRNETMQAVAARIGRAPAQVVLRWIVQQGVVALSMSTKRANMAANLEVLDFALSDADMAAVAAETATGRRIVDLPGLAPDWDA